MQLHSAAARGCIDALEHALEGGSDINARNSNGETALAFALRCAQPFSRRFGPKVSLETITALIKWGANLEIADDLGRTPIHHAAATGIVEFISLLINLGANARHLTKSGYSTILQTCFQPASEGKLRSIERLLLERVSLDAKSEFNEYPLGVCLRFGDLESLAYLIRLGADPSPLGWSDLHHAVAFKDMESIRRLSSSGFSEDLMDSSSCSPWHLALVRGDFEIIRLFIDRGADIHRKGHFGAVPCHFLAEFGHDAALNWILARGVNASEPDDFHNTALHRAAENNHIDCVRTLLKCGAEATCVDHVQTQPVHLAWSVPVLKLLVDAGADINLISGSGDWALKNAAEANDVARVEWILNDGGSVDNTSTGETALHAAVRSDSRETMALLLHRGANPNAQDVDGWTPLFGAQSTEAIQMLLTAGAERTIADQAGWGPEKWLNDPLLLRALSKKK